MAFDPLEVPRQVLADFGIPVQVAPLSGAAGCEIKAQFVPSSPAVGLGQARGHLGPYVFRCLPEEAASLTEGDALSTEGSGSYAVTEVVVVPGKLTEVRAVEQ